MTHGTAPETPAVRVQGLTAGYGKTVILKDISFTVRTGEIFVILGGSGCGKSTLLKQLIGLYAPMAGRVFIGDEELTGTHGRERESILRKFGVTYQSGALFGSMTLLQNVTLPMEEFTNLPPAARSLVARMKLSLVGLAGYEHHMPSELSGGMRKRAAVARAMALDPSILFLDEPSAGLDPVTSAGLDQLILDLRESLGMTCILVTHELPSVYAIADRVIMLDKRTQGVIAQGHPADLRDNSKDQWVRQFFNREADDEKRDDSHDEE